MASSSRRPLHLPFQAHHRTLVKFLKPHNETTSRQLLYTGRVEGAPLFSRHLCLFPGSPLRPSLMRDSGATPKKRDAFTDSDDRLQLFLKRHKYQPDINNRKISSLRRALIESLTRCPSKPGPFVTCLRHCCYATLSLARTSPQHPSPDPPCDRPGHALTAPSCLSVASLPCCRCPGTCTLITLEKNFAWKTAPLTHPTSISSHAVSARSPSNLPSSLMVKELLHLSAMRLSCAALDIQMVFCGDLLHKPSPRIQHPSQACTPKRGARKNLKPLIVPTDGFTDDSRTDESMRPWLLAGASIPPAIFSLLGTSGSGFLHA